MQQGFDPDESAVTMFYVWGNSWSEGLREYWEEKLIAMIAGQDPCLGCTLVSTRSLRSEFLREGLRHQGEVDRLDPRKRDDPARRYWDSFSMRNLIREKAEQGVEPYATYRRRLPTTDPNLRERPDSCPGCRRLEQRAMEFVQRAAARSQVPQQPRRPIHGIDRAVALKLWR